MITAERERKNHCIVIESSQPAVIPRCVQSAQTPNQGMTGANSPICKDLI